jgi:hypothetical protein
MCTSRKSGRTIVDIEINFRSDLVLGRDAFTMRNDLERGGILKAFLATAPA